MRLRIRRPGVRIPPSARTEFGLSGPLGGRILCFRVSLAVAVHRPDVTDRGRCSALRSVSVDACGWRWAMGVDRLPSGSYRARLMVDGKTYSATFTTEPEAAEWLTVARGRAVGARATRRLTLEQYADRWLSEFIDTAANIDHDRRDMADHSCRLWERVCWSRSRGLRSRGCSSRSKPTGQGPLRIRTERPRGSCSPMRWTSASSLGARCQRRDAPDQLSGTDIYSRVSLDMRKRRPR